MTHPLIRVEPTSRSGATGSRPSDTQDWPAHPSRSRHQQNGKIDSWTFQEGTRLDRLEIDKDENGKIDRWEHYVDNKMVKIGTSSRGDGVEDEWAYPSAKGPFVERVESDTDRDGRIDKWENFDASPTPGGAAVLRSVSMDPQQQRKTDPKAPLPPRRQLRTFRDDFPP